MMNKCNFLLVSTLFAQLAIAQQGFDPCFRFVAKDSVKIHLDSSGRPVTQECAYYYKLAKVNPENLTIEGAFEDYYIANNAIATKAAIIDGLLEGSAVSYFANGNKQSEGTYQQGKKIGLWKHWYENGTPYVTYSYENNQVKILEHYSEKGKIQVSKGNGKFKSAKNQRHATAKGLVKNGLPHGTWTLTSNTGNKLIFTEKYEDGTFIKGRGYPINKLLKTNYNNQPNITVDGDKKIAPLVAINKCISCMKDRTLYTNMQYKSPQKDTGFYEYLAKNYTTNNTKGYVLCSFVVTPKKALEDITVHNSSAVIHDDTATIRELIQKSGKWTPRKITHKVVVNRKKGIYKEKINQPIPTVINFIIHYTDKGYIFYPETITTGAIQIKK